LRAVDEQRYHRPLHRRSTPTGRTRSHPRLPQEIKTDLCNRDSILDDAVPGRQIYNPLFPKKRPIVLSSGVD
jgi:hypothetical protein